MSLRMSLPLRISRSRLLGVMILTAPLPLTVSPKTATRPSPSWSRQVRPLAICPALRLAPILFAQIRGHISPATIWRAICQCPEPRILLGPAALAIGREDKELNDRQQMGIQDCSHTAGDYLVIWIAAAPIASGKIMASNPPGKVPVAREYPRLTEGQPLG